MNIYSKFQAEINAYNDFFDKRILHEFSLRNFPRFESTFFQIE